MSKEAFQAELRIRVGIAQAYAPHNPTGFHHTASNRMSMQGDSPKYEYSRQMAGVRSTQPSGFHHAGAAQNKPDFFEGGELCQ